MTMASLDEVYGGKYGSGSSSKDTARPKIYNSPNRRTEGALESNSKLVEDLARSLPISKDGNSDDRDNYAPVKFDDAETHAIRDLGRQILDTRSTCVKLYIAFFRSILAYLDSI